ncbi:hypothetical protein [Cupriavidus sp. UME77]|uniref:hypothetical protein n=1 Tax=Cupriavidus sp. UME77 TaxID=1862321 RepID=UPI00160381DF|nr:hypothetical protein [Cupriavidus sp. UME77]
MKLFLIVMAILSLTEILSDVLTLAANRFRAPTYAGVVASLAKALVILCWAGSLLN